MPLLGACVVASVGLVADADMLFVAVAIAVDVVGPLAAVLVVAVVELFAGLVAVDIISAAAAAAVGRHSADYTEHFDCTV